MATEVIMPALGMAQEKGTLLNWLKAEGESLCRMELEPSRTAVKLSITHTIQREPSKFIEAASGGWPKVISNLKSLLETGSVALQDPYPTGNPYGRR